MARTLIREALEAAWVAHEAAKTRGESPYGQLRAGVRAYLDYVSDRNRMRREKAKADRENQ